MSASAGNSLLTVVVVPGICAVVGLLLFGPFGFFAGAVLALVLGAVFENQRRETEAKIAEKDQRIAELEDRVDELEGSSEG